MNPVREEIRIMTENHALTMLTKKFGVRLWWDLTAGLNFLGVVGNAISDELWSNVRKGLL